TPRLIRSTTLVPLERQRQNQRRVPERKKVGKQPARATSPADPSDVERTKAQQLKIVLRRSRHETHISQQGGSSTDEGTGSRPGVPDVSSDDSEEELSWNSSNDEDVDDQTKGSNDNEGKKTDESDDDNDDQDEAKKVNNDDDDEEEISKIDEQEATESDESDDEATESNRESEDEETREQEEESFDPIPRTHEDSEDDENNEEDQGLRIGEEERMHEEEGADELYRDVDINQGRGLQVKTQVKAQVTRILPRIEESVNTKLEAEVLTRSSHSSRTSYVVEADLSEMELKEILIEKMEENKSMHRSDEQRNLYKALVEAYDADNTILDTYGESAILKRRREDDDHEGPSAGSDRGSKRQREGGEHASVSTLSEPTTGSAGRSTTGTQSRQLSASESAFAEEPVQTTC
nr:hypothetical protein [Tanacetum cinerariifolium]